LGAGGNLGRRLVTRGLAHGHELTAFVRSESRFLDAWGGGDTPLLKIVEEDVARPRDLAGAIVGHDALVNAAGTVTDEESFSALVDLIIEVAGS
jgi:putative NADH-flavin reductase